MNHNIRWLMRGLALGHFAWGIVLLSVAGWVFSSFMSAIPFMTTKTNFITLLSVLLFDTVFVFPVMLLGLWMIALGRWTWLVSPRLRSALLWTHGMMLGLGSLAIIVGIQAVGAAERSAAQGGGLLSPLAWIPLLFGVPAVVLAAFSLAAVWLILPADHSPEHKSLLTTPADGHRPKKLLFAWVLLACGFSLFLRAIWLNNASQPATSPAKVTHAQMSADVETLHDLAAKSPEDAAAFLRDVIINGRLTLLWLSDSDATLALVAAHLPAAFACLDTLETEYNQTIAQIERQRGPRTSTDGEIEERHVQLLTQINELLSVLRDIQHVPANIEAFLGQRGTRKGLSQAVAITLIGKLNIPTDRRSALLMPFVANSDSAVGYTARQALAQMGIQITPETTQPTETPFPFVNPPLPQQDATHDQTARNSETLFFIFIDARGHPEVMAIENPASDSIAVEAGVGVWQPEFVLQWSVFADYGQIKIEQQMETSLSISGDGPHLDLSDWKHYETTWKELPRIGSNRWQSVAFSAEELTSFPPVTVAEVKAQVRRQLQNSPEGLEFWLKQAEACTPPFMQACFIGPSRAVIKMSVKKGADWIVIKRIDIRIPMGC